MCFRNPTAIYCNPYIYYYNVRRVACSTLHLDISFRKKIRGGPHVEDPNFKTHLMCICMWPGYFVNVELYCCILTVKTFAVCLVFQVVLMQMLASVDNLHIL